MSKKDFTIYVGGLSIDAPLEYQAFFHDTLKVELSQLEGVLVLSGAGDICNYHQEIDLFVVDACYPSADSLMVLMERQAAQKPSLFLAGQTASKDPILANYLAKFAHPVHRASSTQTAVELVWMHVLSKRPDLANAVMV